MRAHAFIIVAIAMLTATCTDDPTLGSIESKESGSVVYTGTLSGNAFVKVRPSSGSSVVNLYIVNMKVEVLMVNTDVGTTVIGTGVTGEDGRFEVPFSIDSPEESIEVYLHFIAESGDGMIRVRKKGLFSKWSRSQDLLQEHPLLIEASNPTLTKSLGDVELDTHELKPQLLHWANRARKFVIAELGRDSPLPTDPASPLDILEPPLFKGAITFFVPATSINTIVELAIWGVIALAPPLGFTMLLYVETQFSDQDALYISESAEEDDETTMHEFGHYLMWHAQGKKWLNPLEASFATHYDFTNSNNSMLAWTEGFADGFARTVDSWSYMDDNEDEGDTPDDAPEHLGEYGSPECGSGSGITCNGQATSHGFYSEFYIGHVFYDLWDGAAALTSGPKGSERNVTNGSHDDSGVDQVELAFADIMRPILDTKTGNQVSLIDNINDYYSRLYPIANDRSVKDVFVAGKIKNLQVSAGTDPALQDLPNSDVIAFERDVEVELYKVDISTVTIEKSIGTVIERFLVDVSALLTAKDDYNLGSTPLNGGTLTLSDDLVVDGSAATGAARLTFNSRTHPISWRQAGNTYAAPIGTVFTNSLTFAVTIASGMVLSARDRGTIVLGEATNGQKATVTVASGATLELGGGRGGDFAELDPITNTFVSKGNVVIHPGSKLIIERGATLVINSGAEFLLDGPGSELIIRGNLVVRADATFWWTATNGGMVTFDLANLGGAPNVTLEDNAQILADEVEFTIAPDTYVRPPEHARSRITMRNGARGHFGGNAYLDGSQTVVTLTDSTIDALTSARHDGVLLNGNAHTIRGMTFRGGARCLRDLGTGFTLVVASSQFEDCTTGIDVDGLGVSLDDITIIGAGTGVATRNVTEVAITDSSITGVSIGWHLTNRGSAHQGISNTDILGAGTAVLIDGTNPTAAPPVSIVDGSTLTGNIGLRSVGNLVRIDRSTIKNSPVGVQMESSAVLDLSASASAEFTGNTTSIKLIGAGKPKLDGSNLFYPKTKTVNGTTISGTINESSACGAVPRTITVTSDVWEVWNVGMGAYVAKPMTTSPYNITSMLGCVYTLI